MTWRERERGEKKERENKISFKMGMFNPNQTEQSKYRIYTQATKAWATVICSWNFGSCLKNSNSLVSIRWRHGFAQWHLSFQVRMKCISGPSGHNTASIKRGKTSWWSNDSSQAWWNHQQQIIGILIHLVVGWKGGVVSQFLRQVLKVEVEVQDQDKISSIIMCLFMSVTFSRSRLWPLAFAQSWLCVSPCLEICPEGRRPLSQVKYKKVLFIPPVFRIAFRAVHTTGQ